MPQCLVKKTRRGIRSNLRMVAQQHVSSANLRDDFEWSVVDYDHDDVQQKKY